MLRRLLNGEEGQTLMEYTLILVLIALAVIGAMTLIGPVVNGMLLTAAGI